MKITMFVTPDAMQFNLTDESEHEEAFLKMLKCVEGSVVHVEKSADISMCKGNYIRNFGEGVRSLALVIRKPVADPQAIETLERSKFFKEIRQAAEGIGLITENQADHVACIKLRDFFDLHGMYKDVK